MKTKWHRNAGELTIEATMVIPLVILVIYFLISLCFVVYQRAVVVNTANYAANHIARIYPMLDADPDTGQVDISSLRKIGYYYRYLFGGANTADANNTRVTKLIKDALQARNMIFPNGDPDIQAKVVNDGLGRRHIEVEVTAEYKLPAGVVYSALGIFTDSNDAVITYKAKGSADCIDMIDYINVVGYVGDTVALLEKVPGLSLIQSGIQLTNKFINMLEAFGSST